MLSWRVERVGACPRSCTSRLLITNEAFRYQNLAGKWPPRSELNTRSQPSEGRCRSPSAWRGLAPSAGVEPTNPTFVASGPYPRARRVLVAQCGLEPQSSAHEAPAFTHVLQRRKNGYQSSMDLAVTVFTNANAFGQLQSHVLTVVRGSLCWIFERYSW